MTLKSNAEELALVAQEIAAEVIRGTVRCAGREEGKVDTQEFVASGPFSENTGESIEEAIVIRYAGHPTVGVDWEYAYLEQRFGRRGEDWELEIQSLLKQGDRHYDEMRLMLRDGTRKTIYFDITAFFPTYDRPS